MHSIRVLGENKITLFSFISSSLLKHKEWKNSATRLVPDIII